MASKKTGKKQDSGPRDRRTFAQKAETAIAALEQLRDQVAKESDSAAGLLAAGKICEYSQDLTVARRCYEAALAMDPKFYEARARLALVQLKLGLTSDALRSATTLGTESAGFRFKDLGNLSTYSAMTVLGDGLFANGAEDSALQAYVEALRIEPNDGYAAGRCAQLLLHLGRFKDAVKLSGRIERTGRFDAVISILKLGSNDPALLPAISNLRMSGLSLMSEAG